MFLRSINTQPFLCDLKLARGKAKAHKAEDPDKYPDAIRLHTLDRADVDGLRVVTQPVTKIDLLDKLTRPFCTLEKSKLLEGVFDIAVAKIETLDFGERGDVPCTECELCVS